MSEILKRCPVCKSKPVLWEVTGRNQYGVQCYHNCIYVIPKAGYFSTKEEAINAWNSQEE